MPSITRSKAAGVENEEVLGTKAPTTVAQHGLYTPEATPQPQGRPSPEVNTIDSPQGTGASPAPDPTSTSDTAAGSTGQDANATPENGGPTKDQADAIEHILSCGNEEYRKILRLPETPGTEHQEKERATNSWRRLGCLVHPLHNRGDGAHKAWDILLGAAKHEKIEDEDIKEVQLWDGEEVLEDLQIGEDGHWINPDQMETEPTNKGPTEAHQKIWDQATGAIERLMKNPADVNAISDLQKLNEAISTENNAAGFGGTDFIIDIASFQTFFRNVRPYFDRLLKNPADAEAKTELDKANAMLRDFNRLHHYPEGWVMRPSGVDTPTPLPTTNSQAPSPTANPQTTQEDALGEGRRCTQRSGYVTDGGIEKQIAGFMKVGYGYSLIISHVGKDPKLKILEKVAASKFGKGFGKEYSELPNAVEIVPAPWKTLEGKKIEDMFILGIASDRRDPSGTYTRHPSTIVCVRFGNNATRSWHWRSTLGQRFGQAKVDEELQNWRRMAGQAEPVQPIRKAEKSRKPQATESTVTGNDEPQQA